MLLYLVAIFELSFVLSSLSPSLFSMATIFLCLLALLATLVIAAPYDARELEYNLNSNAKAQTPLDYSGAWVDHNYTESPDSWRFPFYTLFLDRFVNGDPTNDDINGTVFEYDATSNQLRHGGDLVGLTDSLDYLQGMGIKVKMLAKGVNGMRKSDRLLGNLYCRNTFPQSALQDGRILSTQEWKAYRVIRLLMGALANRHHDLGPPLRHHSSMASGRGRDSQPGHVCHP